MIQEKIARNSNNGTTSTVLIDLDSFIKFVESDQTATCTRNSRATQVKVFVAVTNYIIVRFYFGILVCFKI